MKLYVHYEEGPSDDHLTLKLTLPKKWVGQPVRQVLELFLDSYNKKKPDKSLQVSEVYFQKGDGTKIRSSEVVEDVLIAHDDVYVKKGALPGKDEDTVERTTTTESSGPSKLRCRNYGCNAMYAEEENHDTACRFHTAPPVFHDTKKGWSCCPERVYDWDEFNKLEGCATGWHSTVDPKQTFAASPTVAAAAQAEANAPQPVLRSIADYNKENPEASSGVKQATSQAMRKPNSTVKDDGTATCINKGCQKQFVLNHNHATACRFHPSPPVFHDTGKFWSCCPTHVKYDFDAFLAVPGCVVGYHNEGTEEAQERAKSSSRPYS